MTLLSRSRSVNSPTSLPRSQTSAHPKRLAIIASTVSRMLALRSTIAGRRSGRRRILTSLNLAAIDMAQSSNQDRGRKRASLQSKDPLASASGADFKRWLLKFEAAMFENIICDRFGGDDADGPAVSDDRHVAIFADGHFVDDNPDWVFLSDRFGELRHHFTHGQHLQVQLPPGDFVEQITFGQDAYQLSVFDHHRLPDADGLDARDGVSHRIGSADKRETIIRNVTDSVFHNVHLQ